MKTDHIRKDWVFWLMVLGLGSLAACLSGSAAWAMFNFLANAPTEVSAGFGVVTGLMFFLYTLNKFGVRVDPGLGPF